MGLIESKIETVKKISIMASIGFIIGLGMFAAISLIGSGTVTLEYLIPPAIAAANIFGLMGFLSCYEFTAIFQDTKLEKRIEELEKKLKEQN